MKSIKGRYSIFSLLRNAINYHEGWKESWRSPEPKSEYDVIIIGGGGHGLGTAYYLAKEHGITNVAVLEKGWIGGGNTGRNTTIVRSNYLLDGNSQFYELSMKLWEDLSRDLNYNVMFSQRGVLNLAHSDPQVDALQRRGNAMRLNGIDAEFWDIQKIRRRIPLLDTSDKTRYPIFGGLMQPRAGTARHDAVAWGFARAADSYGIDIIQNCEVIGINVNQNKIFGLETTQGSIKTKKIGVAVAGHTTQLMDMVNLRMPIESHILQAMVSEPIKPCLHSVVTSGATHLYISQSDKGELVIGGDLDFYNSFAQRGNFPAIEHVVQSAVTMFPAFGRLRLLRTWGGVMDMTMDGSPIICKTPIDGLYLNGGWCYGGFKATPGSAFVFAHTIAQDKPHPQNECFGLDRFEKGYTLDEKGAGPVPKAH